MFLCMIESTPKPHCEQYMTKIVAIDPGVSTGVAIKGNDEYLTITLTLEEIKQGALLEIVQGADQVIIEFFAAFASHGMRVAAPGIRAIEVVGKVMAYCEMQNIPLARQSPQNRKAFMLQARKLAKRYSTPHEIDALAHLLTWEYLNKNQKAIEARRQS